MRKKKPKIIKAFAPVAWDGTVFWNYFGKTKKEVGEKWGIRLAVDVKFGIDIKRVEIKVIEP